MLARRVSLRTLFVFCAALCTLCFAAYPFLALVLVPLKGGNSDGGWLIFWVLIVTLGVLRYALILTCFTSALVLLNNSVPKQSRGRLNGGLVSVVSVFKALGPAVGAVFFAWSLPGHTSQHGWNQTDASPPSASNQSGHTPPGSTGARLGFRWDVRGSSAFFVCVGLSLGMTLLSLKLPHMREKGGAEPAKNNHDRVLT